MSTAGPPQGARHRSAQREGTPSSRGPGRLRRWLCAALVLAAGAGAALAQAYPAKPVQLVVAFAPGGAGDTVARLVARQLAEGLGQPVVVENRPVPVAAAALVAKARPDGHTLLMAGSGTALTSALFDRLPYDLQRDFRPVSTLASFDLVLVTGGRSGLSSVAELLAFARAHPGRLTVGTARVGSTQNLAAELLRAMAGVDVLIVPYRTVGDLVSAVRANDVQVAVEMLPAVLGPIRGGTVQPLGVLSASRFALLPQVPTLAESGLPGFEAVSWNGIAVPAGTPPAVVERLAVEIGRAVAAPQVRQALLQLGFAAAASSPAQMAQRMDADIAKWRAVIDRAGIARQ
ncbi:MAG: tripartite tricarboxylate transporter substrate-binding protein [Pseudorhodoferax sp.]